MKNSNLLLILLFVFTAISCQKEPTTITTSSTFDGLALMGGSPYPENVDGYVILEFEEYFDDRTGGVSATFAAGLKDNGTLINAGTVRVNAFELDKLSDNRLLLFPPLTDKSEFLGQSVSIKFNSNNAGGFSDFTKSVYVPKQMSVSSNIGRGDYFNKSQDLVLSWTPDNNTDKVYIAICTPGLPCIFKEADDTGSLTISNSEFSHFPVGKDIAIHMGRGTQTCLMVGQKEVCITAFNNARIPWLTIQ
jgi:hypothetical protein